MTAATSYDLVVVGGGIIGASIAWGALRAGASVAVVDGDDGDFRASVGNFGLLWVQGKGVGAPHYAGLTQASVRAWGAFSTELREHTGIDVAYRGGGGYQFILTPAEKEKHIAQAERLQEESGDIGMRFVDGDTLRRDYPFVGPRVLGAIRGTLDGDVNPLALLHALHRALELGGATFLRRNRVLSIRPQAAGFVLDCAGRRIAAGRVVIAAGLAGADLARQVGIDLALFPQRGQVMVTERARPFLNIINSSVRQNAEGTLMMGSTQENVGFDKRVTPVALSRMARRAATIFPALEHLRIVRFWACLRVMTPDGLPIYAQSERFPGAYAVTAHSGVTLAATNAGVFAPAILESGLPPEFAGFRPDRFGDWQSHAGGTEH